MLIAIIPIVILVVGILMWVLATNPFVKEAGKIMFFCGMLVTTFIASRATWRLGMIESIAPAMAQVETELMSQG